MEGTALAEYVRDKLGDRVVDTLVAHGTVTVTVEPDAFPVAARLCRDDPRLSCDFFDWLSAVDEREDGFGVIAALYSVRHRHEVLIRAVAPGGRDEPRMPTITHVYRGADWHERETYDMFGVVFEGHPSLLPRILNVENFEGWPLRKEFFLTTREVKPWPGAKEPEETPAAGADQAGAEPKVLTDVPTEDKAAAAKAKAERAKAKAAAMRKQKAAERAAAAGDPAAAEGAIPSESTSDSAAPPPTATDASGGEGLPAKPPAPAAPDLSTADAVAEAPEATGDVDEPDATEERAAMPSAAGDDVPEGTPRADEPLGAAEVADSAVAKDAAAGAVGGDVAAGAPGDVPNVDEPVEDLEAEAFRGEGAEPAASGAPGIEAEGRHGGAEVQGARSTETPDGSSAVEPDASATGPTSTDAEMRPAAETPGMTAESPGRAARDQRQVPAPDVPEASAGDPAAGGQAGGAHPQGAVPPDADPHDPNDPVYSDAGAVQADRPDAAHQRPEATDEAASKVAAERADDAEPGGDDEREEP